MTDADRLAARTTRLLDALEVRGINARIVEGRLAYYGDGPRCPDELVRAVKAIAPQVHAVVAAESVVRDASQNTKDNPTERNTP